MRALVTGVSGNIGRATAKLLLAQGWEVVGVARQAKPLDFESGPNSRFSSYKLDLTDHLEASRFIYSSAPFDLGVVTHGIQIPDELKSNSFYYTYQEVTDVNLDSVVYLTYLLANQDKLNPGSLIVYCSSIQATQTRRGRLPYGIAKAGLEALARGVAVELAPKVRAVALRLGQLDATMKNITFDEQQLKAITNRLPLSLVKSENVARMILSLYDQTEVSGTVVEMDSAHHLAIWP